MAVGTRVVVPPQRTTLIRFDHRFKVNRPLCGLVGQVERTISTEDRYEQRRSIGIFGIYLETHRDTGLEVVDLPNLAIGQIDR
ncbi:MAG: hypothetical protein V9F03_14740 [Microthrixaceae bacterium]